MKKLSILIVALFTTLSINAQTITGVWNTGEDNTKIEITEENGVYKGEILSSDNTKAKAGSPILKDVKFNNGKGNGKIYAAKRGEWYDAVLEENDNQLDIKIKVGFMSKTIAWKKD